MGAMISKSASPVNERHATGAGRPEINIIGSTFGQKKALQERRLENLKGYKQKKMIRIIKKLPRKGGGKPGKNF